MTRALNEVLAALLAACVLIGLPAATVHAQTAQRPVAPVIPQPTVQLPPLPMPQALPPAMSPSYSFPSVESPPQSVTPVETLSPEEPVTPVETLEDPAGPDAAAAKPEAAEADDVMSDQRGERDYADLCGERLRNYESLITEHRERDSKDPLLSRFSMTDKADKEAFKALKTYCSTGRFRIGTLDDKQECTDTIELTRLHTELIRHLMTVRAQPAELVMLACVKTPETLSFWAYRAHGILMSNSEIGRVEIAGAQISYGVYIAGKSKIPGGLSIDASSLGRLLEISGGSEFGTSGKDKPALEIRRTTIEGGLRINNATFASDVYAPSNRIDGSLDISKAAFGGELDLSNSSVGTETSFKDTTIGANFFIRSSHMRTLKFASLTVMGGTYAKLMKIDGALRIEESHFEKEVELDRLSARQVMIFGSSFGSDKSPADGTLSLAAATTGSVTISKCQFSSDVFAGNTRTGAFDLVNVKTPTFDCTDCIVDQYMTLGGLFSKEVRLWGAQIKSQLRLRERNACAIWQGNPVFDLRGLQTKTIAADYRDLELSGTPVPGRSSPGCPRRTVRTLISGADFEQIIPGFRSAAADTKKVPDDIGPGLDADFAKCRETTSQGSILDHEPSDILCWIREGLEGADTGKPVYDPRPYQLIASALEKSGRADSGTEIRIAKVEAEDSAFVKDIWYRLKKPFKIVSHYVSGYGYHNEWALAWFFALVGCGFLAYLFGRSPHSSGIPHVLKPGAFGLAWYSFWFSVDRAVPPLLLDNSMSEYSMLRPWARYYFYLHRALGTFIITIAIASLTGAFK